MENWEAVHPFVRTLLQSKYFDYLSTIYYLLSAPSCWALRIRPRCKTTFVFVSKCKILEQKNGPRRKDRPKYMSLKDDDDFMPVSTLLEACYLQVFLMFLFCQLLSNLALPINFLKM